MTMTEKNILKCQIYCQKGKQIDASFPMDVGIYERAGMDAKESMCKEAAVHAKGTICEEKGICAKADIYGEGNLKKAGIYEKDGIRIKITQTVAGGCQLGEICLHMKNEPCRENFNLRMEKPVRVYLPMEKPEKITAMYLYNEWWTRPAFVTGFREIPDHTQVAFLKYQDRFACLVPMVGRQFKTYLINGTETEICLEMTACMGGQKELAEPLCLLAEAPTLAKAVQKAFTWLAKYKGIRMRGQRRIPEMFRYLGWCSWDAFYTDVTEEKIREKACELSGKNIPVKWMLMDDGWLSVQDEMLDSFAPDKKKFPDGFGKMTEEIRASGNIRWFGVWHALGGYWGGVLPESPLDKDAQPYLYRAVNGKLIPSPQTGEGFYRDWYERLRREGIDFAKVDGQSAVPYYFENSLPVAEAARGMGKALESGAFYMDGAIINCMGMAMESILARPTSAVSRNSDDFVPDKENGFTEHLLQNAYNAVYHNELYCCDWDMFWTKHKDGVKHSLLRAISGGPVYFSDKIGDTNPEVLKPLVYGNGEVLMMDRAAKPTQDCMFCDPTKDGVLKLHNAAPWGADKKGGGIAVYNLTGKKQAFTFRPSDIPELDVSETYWAYDYFNRKACAIGREEVYEGTAEAEGFAWFIILAQGKNGTCLGLVDKYAGFLAVESIWESEHAQTVVVHESGALGWLSEKEPVKVMVNAKDVTGQVQRDGDFYMVSLPEDGCKTVLSVFWG